MIEPEPPTEPETNKKENKRFAEHVIEKLGSTLGVRIWLTGNFLMVAYADGATIDFSLVGTPYVFRRAIEKVLMKWGIMPDVTIEYEPEDSG